MGLSWEHFRRAYIFAMTKNVISQLKHHSHILLGPEAQEMHQQNGGLDEDKILSCTSLLDFDELYSRRRAGYNSVEEYYNASSCCHVMDKVHTA
jgi:predicted alpha/beta-fold hydrolase